MISSKTSIEFVSIPGNFSPTVWFRYICQVSQKSYTIVHTPIIFRLADLSRKVKLAVAFWNRIKMIVCKSSNEFSTSVIRSRKKSWIYALATVNVLLCMSKWMFSQVNYIAFYATQFSHVDAHFYPRISGRSLETSEFLTLSYRNFTLV